LNSTQNVCKGAIESPFRSGFRKGTHNCVQFLGKESGLILGKESGLILGKESGLILGKESGLSFR